MLTVEGVDAAYGAHQVLHHIDLSLGDGEILGVLGPSGCGKSTLLRVIAGLEVPTAGRVLWDGEDITGVAPHRRNFGLMFQEHALFPHRDVAGNVAFGLRMQGRPRAAIAARVAEVLELVGMAGTERRPVHELSGGERQRIALARALAPEPRLLMLDEPLGSLDRRLRERLVEEVGALLRRLAVTAIVVTHDHDEAEAMADRVAVMHAGRIEQVAPMDELRRNPATAFVAEFVGTA